MHHPGTGFHFNIHPSTMPAAKSSLGPPVGRRLHGLLVPVGIQHKALAPFLLLFSEQYCETHCHLRGSCSRKMKFIASSGYLRLHEWQAMPKLNCLTWSLSFSRFCGFAQLAGQFCCSSLGFFMPLKVASGAGVLQKLHWDAGLSLRALPK